MNNGKEFRSNNDGRRQFTCQPLDCRLPVDDRQIATEAVYLCLRNKTQINRMELGSAIRELRRRMRANDLSQ